MKLASCCALCIAYKCIFEIQIKQQTIYYILIISKIKQ